MLRAARAAPATVVAHLERWAEGLRSCPYRLVIPDMSNKEVVSDLLTRLPDNVSLQQIAREVEFVAGVREGLDQLERGEGVAIEKVETLIESWTTK